MQRTTPGKRLPEIAGQILPAETRDAFRPLNEWHAEIAKVFQPVLRGFLLPAAVYYAIVVFLHYADEPFDNFLLLGGLAAVTSVTGFAFYFALRRPNVSFNRTELYAVVIFALVFANILAYHLLHLEVPKLVYFVLLTLAIATAGVSLRVIIPLTTVSLATAILLAGQAGPETQAQFAYIALASAFIAVGMAVLMRTAVKREITARLKAEEAQKVAQAAADYDFLTGLPNRRSFFHRLDEIFCHGSAGRHLALGLIDLNGFKHVNDLHGHAFGDQLLTDVGRRIRDACGADAFVARLGGDEFAIMIERPVSDRVLMHLGAEVRAAVGRCYEIAGNEITISGAVGFARRLATTSSPAMLYEYADFALYRAKESYGGAVEIFSAADEAELESIKQVEHHLTSSSFEDEMHVEYQPMVQVPENRVIGFEGLARWQSPQLGRVPPDIFIRAAERCGLMNRLTPALLRKALADACDWPPDLRLSFNLSARDVVSTESIDQICEIVRESGFPGERIDFEITETSIMTDFERVRTSLARIRGLGAHIALDDFGVGYSNFQHLDELKIDKLKIDRRFVSRMVSEETSKRIVRTMIEMCTNLGLICVIEGVENETELDAVMHEGGTIVQGFHFSRPMVNDNVVPFLKATANGTGPMRRSA